MGRPSRVSSVCARWCCLHEADSTDKTRQWSRLVVSADSALAHTLLPPREACRCELLLLLVPFRLRHSFAAGEGGRVSIYNIELCGYSSIDSVRTRTRKLMPKFARGTLQHTWYGSNGPPGLSYFLLVNPTSPPDATLDYRLLAGKSLHDVELQVPLCRTLERCCMPGEDHVSMARSVQALRRSCTIVTVIATTSGE